MRNSVFVIFGLAAVLFVAGSDSAAVREERVKRASDVVSKFASAMLGDQLSRFGIPIKPEESLMDKRFFYRNSPLFEMESPLPESFFNLGAALGQLEADLEEILFQIKELIMPQGIPSQAEMGRSNTHKFRATSRSTKSGGSFSAAIKAISQLGKTISKFTPPIIISPEINQPQRAGGTPLTFNRHRDGPFTLFRQRDGPFMFFRQKDDPDNVPEDGTSPNFSFNSKTISALLKKILYFLDLERYPFEVETLPFDPVAFLDIFPPSFFDPVTFPGVAPPSIFDPETFPGVVPPPPFDTQTFPDVAAPPPFDTQTFPDVAAPPPFDTQTFPDVAAPPPFLPFSDTPVHPVAFPEDTPTDTADHPVNFPEDFPATDTPFEPEFPPAARSKSQNFPAIPQFNPMAKSTSNEFGKPRPFTKPKPRPVPFVKSRPKPVPPMKPYPSEGIPNITTEPTDTDENEQETTVGPYENGMTENEDGTYNFVPAVFRLRMKKN